MRAVLDPLLYQNRTGCQWEMVPHDLLPQRTVYEYFAQWREDGTWVKILSQLRMRVRMQEGREPTPRAASSTAHRCRRQRSAVQSGEMTAARKSKGANVTCSWIR